MAFFEELNELRKFLLPCLGVFLAFSALCFVFGITQIELFGESFYFLVPTFKSFSVQFLEIIKENLLPEGVQLIATNPLNAFFAQITVSLFLGLVFSLPFILYKFIKYLVPALYGKEKKIVFKVLAPSFFLFGAGCLFAYFVLIPLTFDILYSYAERMGAALFFTINEFVGMVLAFIVVTGIIFLLPVFMVLLSRLGIIRSSFWQKNWRYAILASLIFSAIITPDGTGITMLILSLPMVGLYFLGCLLS